MLVIRLCLWSWLTQAILGQIELSGTVLESSGRADFRTVPGFDNWPRFVGVIEQNKISDSFCHYCIITSLRLHIQLGKAPQYICFVMNHNLI